MLKWERIKKFKVYFLIAVLIIIFVGLRFLFPKYVTKRYDSVEAAFKYQEGEDVEVILALDGEKSTYVVGSDGVTYRTNIFQRKENYWQDVKLPNILSSYTKSNLRYRIEISEFNDEDAYVSVIVRKSSDAVVYDSCGSEFICIPISEKSTSIYTMGFYAYVEDMDDDYWVNVGEQKISMN